MEKYFGFLKTRENGQVKAQIKNERFPDRRHNSGDHFIGEVNLNEPLPPFSSVNEEVYKTYATALGAILVKIGLTEEQRRVATEAAPELTLPDLPYKN
jgi:hypothetical protein